MGTMTASNIALAARRETARSKTAPKRSVLISLRLTADEHADLRAAAANADLTVADFLRRAANYMTERGCVLDRDERAWAAGIAEELRRAGVNLNQVARAVNGGRIAHTDELRAELHDHISVVRTLAYAYAHLSDGAARAGRLAADRHAPTP